MTSWPWMKGVEIAIADPIPLVNELDERPSVKELIDKHRTQIDSVAQRLQDDPLYDNTRHDDLWILRFVLSHKKKIGPAVKAAKYTLKFRVEHKLDAEDLRPYPPNDGPDHPRKAAGKRYLALCGEDASRFCLPDARRGVIGFIQLSSIDQHKVATQLPEDDWLPTLMYMSEWTHQWLDYTTRTTGRLTKNVRFANADGFRLAMLNKEAQRRDGIAMGLMEDCYPQLLQTIYVINSPSLIQTLWRIVRPFFPKRVVEKFDFITPQKNARELKRVLRYISEEDLPARFGGKYEAWPVNIPLPPTN